MLLAQKKFHLDQVTNVRNYSLFKKTVVAFSSVQ